MELLGTSNAFRLTSTIVLAVCMCVAHASATRAELHPASQSFLFSTGSALHIAAKEGNIETVKRLIEQEGHDVETTANSFNMTPLFWAVHDGQRQIIEYLTSRNANFNHVDSFGKTPIFYATYIANRAKAVAIIEYLAKCGANLEAPAGRTTTLLLAIVAASTRSNSLPLELTRRGAKPLIEEDNAVLRVAFLRGQSHDKRTLLKQLLPEFRRETCKAARIRAQCINDLLQAKRIPDDLGKLIWEMELPWSQHILTGNCLPPS